MLPLPLVTYTHVHTDQSLYTQVYTHVYITFPKSTLIPKAIVVFHIETFLFKKSHEWLKREFKHQNT